jgi:hypothetical protein
MSESQVSERKRSLEKYFSDSLAPFYINFDEISKQVLFDMKVDQLVQNTGLISRCEF